MELIAKDATEAFEDVGHSDEARETLNTLLVGEFDGGNVSRWAFSSPWISLLVCNVHHSTLANSRSVDSRSLYQCFASTHPSRFISHSEIK